MAEPGTWARRGALALLALLLLSAVVRRPDRGLEEEAQRAALAGTGALAGEAGAAAALLLEESEAAEVSEAEAPTGKKTKKNKGFWKLVILLHVCAIAYCYRAHRRHALGEQTAWSSELGEIAGTGGFAYSPWEVQGCLNEDRTLLLCSCCCLCVQWADTLSSDKLRLGRFWPLLVVSALCVINSRKIHQPHIVLVLLAVYFRQRLRAAYGLPRHTLRTCGEDCLLWCCCAPFAALQEARQVEHVPLRHSPKGKPPPCELLGAPPV